MSSQLTIPQVSQVRDVLKHMGSALAVGLLLVGGFWGSHLLAPHHGDLAHETNEASPRAAQIAVTLAPEKLAAANIRVARATVHDLRPMRTVAATLDYDSARHLTLRAPVDCIVDQTLVTTGQTVAEGEQLAAVSSAEVALARTEFSKSSADLRVVELEHSFAKQTHDNLRSLLDALEGRPSVSDIEQQFGDASLGEYGASLMTAYSEFMLASRAATRAQPLGEQGIIAGRVQDERVSARDVAAATFRAACERASYQSRRLLTRREAELNAAQHSVAVAGERLSLLLGPFADDSTPATPGEFEIRAPFSGRIESIPAAPGTRVPKGDPILILADTSQLWISAMVHQHDWGMLQLALDQTIHFQVPALPDEQFTAKVIFVGAKVSPETRAIPLVAKLDNPADRLRPGMFAWVSLPVDARRKRLAVPVSAVQRHESETFVFVQESERQFRKQVVTVGFQTPELIEIVDGLSPGQPVVESGAFYLKSELLLEQED